MNEVRSLGANLFWAMIMVSFLGAHTAMAGQEAEAPWALSIGAYASMAPAYSGSDEYELSPGFYADGYLALSEELMILIDGTALALNYQPFKFMDIGLLGSYRKGRDNDDDDTLDGMSDIDDTVEVGPYIGLAFTEHVYLELSTLFDVGDAHKGWIAEAGLSYMDTVGETPLSYQLGIAVRYAGKDFNDTYYGVRESDATPARAAYEGEEGLHSIAANVFLSYQLHQHWNLVNFVMFEQLLDPVAESSLVKEESQISVGLGLEYKF